MTDAVDVRRSEVAVRLGEFIFRPGDGTLESGRGVQTLTPKAVALLDRLIASYPHTAARQQLLDEVWGVNRGSPETIAQVLRELRRKLGDRAHAPRFIRTASKVGFQLLVEPVHVDTRSGSDAEIERAASEPNQRQSAHLQPGASQTVPRPEQHRRHAPWRVLAPILLGAIVLTGFLLLMPLSRDKSAPGTGSGRMTLVADDSVTESMPRPLFDGSGFVYSVFNPATASRDIAFKRYGDARPRIFERAGSDEFSPVPSRDGSVLALVRMSDDGCTILVGNLVGPLERAVARCETSIAGRAIDMNASGTLLAFTQPTNAPFESRTVAVMDIASGRSDFITDAASMVQSDYAPRLSPGAEFVSFFRHDYDTGAVELRVQRVRAGSVSEAVSVPSGERIEAHAWSSTGSFFVLVGGAGDSSRLLELEVPGWRVKRVLDRLPRGRHLSVEGSVFLASTLTYKDSRIVRLDLADDVDVVPRAVTTAKSRHGLPRLSADGSTVLFAAGPSALSEIWAAAVDTEESARVASLEGSQLLDLQWVRDRSSILALLRDEHDEIQLAEFEYPAGRQLGTRACPEGAAIIPLAAGRFIVKHADGRYTHGCETFANGAKAQDTINGDPFTVRSTFDGRLVGGTSGDSGIWELDASLRPIRLLAPYARGTDFSWDIRGEWFVSLRAGRGRADAPLIVRKHLPSSTVVSLDLQGIDVTQGVEIDGDGRVFVVLNELADSDIIRYERSDSTD